MPFCASALQRSKENDASEEGVSKKPLILDKNHCRNMDGRTLADSSELSLYNNLSWVRRSKKNNNKEEINA